MINRDKLDLLIERLIEVSDPASQGAGDNRELIASYVADQIVQMVIIDRFFMHAIKDVRYNPDNESILIVLHSNFNDYVDTILEMIAQIKSVKTAESFERTSEEGFKYYVIKALPDFDLSKDGKGAEEYAPGPQPTATGRIGDISQFGTY
jgi:hypothetical protein